jgi:hypothetical protein
MEDPKHLNYGEIVAGMSRVLTTMSREIATALQESSG